MCVCIFRETFVIGRGRCTKFGLSIYKNACRIYVYRWTRINDTRARRARGLMSSRRKTHPDKPYNLFPLSVFLSVSGTTTAAEGCARVWWWWWWNDSDFIYQTKAADGARSIWRQIDCNTAVSPKTTRVYIRINGNYENGISGKRGGFWCLAGENNTRPRRASCIKSHFVRDSFLFPKSSGVFSFVSRIATCTVYSRVKQLVPTSRYVTFLSVKTRLQRFRKALHVTLCYWSYLYVF